MKKCIAMILAIVMFAGLACGCANDSDTSTGDTTKEKTVQTNKPGKKSHKKTTLNKVDTSKFTNAEDYDSYEWPTIGIASEIPVPAWSDRGMIVYEAADCFECYVGYTTKEDFTSYVQELKDFGFVKYYQSAGTAYYAETEDGWGIMVNYSQYSSSMILIAARDYSTMHMHAATDGTANAN